MTKMTLRTQGKIILCGEHAVIYGAPAIAMPFDKGMDLSLSSEGRKDTLSLTFDQGKTLVFGDAFGEPLCQMLHYIGSKFPELFLGKRIDVRSEIPTSAGLGSSAALSVGLLRLAFSLQDAAHVSDALLFEETLVLETFFHGRPSGVDHATVIASDLIRFQRSPQESASWKTIEVQNKPNILVAFAGKHVGTQKAVRVLGERAKADPFWFQDRIQQIASITPKLEQALIDHDEERLGLLFDENHAVLRDFGVSTPRIELICQEARRAGAFGAKLTGAGCGGAVLAAVPSSRLNEVKEHLSEFAEIL
jgi:mevalonate kinase